MAYVTLGVIILWFGWFGFNPGSTLSVDFGGVGFFAYVAMNTNIAAAAGVLGAVSTAWVVIKKPDLSMMLNGAIAGLVAITASCAFVAPWAAVIIGFVAGVIVVFGVLFVEKIGVDDPIGAIAAHGMAGVWGTLSLGFLTMPSLATKLATGKGGLFYGGGLHQLGTQALGLAAVGALHVRRVVPRAPALQGHGRHPYRSGRRVRRAGRLRARHVGVSGVLHPGSRRLWHGSKSRHARSQGWRRGRGARVGGHRADRVTRTRIGRLHDGASRSIPLVLSRLLRSLAAPSHAVVPNRSVLKKRRITGRGGCVLDAEAA